MKKTALVSRHNESFESILKVLNETSQNGLESFLDEFEPKDVHFCL